MKNTAILSLICIAITTTIFGCNNPKAANKENFAKVLNDYIAKNPHSLPSPFSFKNLRRCTLYLGQFPQNLVSFEPDRGYNADLKNKALKNAGIMTSEIVKEEEIKSTLVGGIEGKQILTKYELSEKGKQMAKQDNNGNFYIPYCQVAFKEVKLFTEPADAFGAKVSQVDYTYAIEKVEDWVNHPEILQAYPDVKEALEYVGKPIDDKKALVLTSEGWSTGEK